MDAKMSALFSYAGVWVYVIYLLAGIPAGIPPKILLKYYQMKTQVNPRVFNVSTNV